MGKVKDYYGADIRRYKFHALARSGCPPLQISRIIAERVSAARFFCHGAVYLTPSSKLHETTAVPHGAP